MPGLNVFTKGLDNRTDVAGTTDPTGRFHICGVRANAGIDQVAMRMVHPTRKVSATIPSGQLVATELRNAQPIPNLRMTLGETPVTGEGILRGACPGLTGAVYSQNNGTFPTFCANAPFMRLISRTLPSPAATLWDVGTIALEPNLADVSFKVRNPGGAYFTEATQSIQVTDGLSYTGVRKDFQPILVKYPVRGIVREAGTGQALEGMKVTTPNEPTAGLTDDQGRYLIDANISLRSSATQPGLVSVTAGGATATNTGFLYESRWSGNITVPSRFDVLDPIDFDFSLDRQGGGM
jgi:hypothetical protein